MRRWQHVVLTAGLLVAGFSLTPVTYSQAPSCFVVTGNGNVQGLDNGTSCAFLGIPFAAPPIGPLRWKPPQPAAPWAVTLNAITPPSNCALVNPPSPVQIGNEDCLRLIVWTPDPMPVSPAPVIVWIHTGAFMAASANLAAHNGRALAERTGAIVVAANYRVGAFGFLAHPALTSEDPAYPSSGNYGLLDQRAAMAWVRDNIAAFGGDPNNVTIGGQSAGGHSVSFHLVSPGSGGLFGKAIMQSGYASSRWPTLEESEVMGLQFATSLGCTTPGAELSCLRGKSRSEVLTALPSRQQQVAETDRAVWGPNVDGVEIPDQPRSLYETGTFNRVPVIIGATRDEGWIYVDRSFPLGLTEAEYAAAVETEFGLANAPAILAMYPAAAFPTPKHAYSRVVGDAEGSCEAQRVAHLISRTQTPVYLYSFEREVPAVAGTQVIHGIDPNFVFGNNYGAPTPYVLSDDDRSLSNAIGDYWVRFAATGDPNDGIAFKWHQFISPAAEARAAEKYMVLDLPLREDKRPREEQCNFWEPYFYRSLLGAVPAGK
jgi:para-nitrobenzyl esterase